MTQQYAALTLRDVDYGGSIGTKDVTFELAGDGPSGAITYTDEIRTGYLVDDVADDLVSIFATLLDDGEELRKSISIDVGGGQRAISLEFVTPGETTKSDGSQYQWGSSADPADGPNAHTATGVHDGYTQMQVFINALRLATPDSLTPAELTIGEHSSSGVLDSPLKVAVESPTLTLPNTSAGQADGSVTLVEMRDLSGLLDGEKKQPK